MTKYLILGQSSIPKYAEETPTMEGGSQILTVTITIFSAISSYFYRFTIRCERGKDKIVSVAKIVCLFENQTTFSFIHKIKM